MVYLNRKDQAQLLQHANDDNEVKALMRKVHFDDDMLCEYTSQHSIETHDPKGEALREFMLVLGAGLLCITLASHAVDWWLDREAPVQHVQTLISKK